MIFLRIEIKKIVLGRNNRKIQDLPAKHRGEIMQKRCTDY